MFTEQKKWEAKIFPKGQTAGAWECHWGQRANRGYALNKHIFTTSHPECHCGQRANWGYALNRLTGDIYSHPTEPSNSYLWSIYCLNYSPLDNTQISELNYKLKSINKFTFSYFRVMSLPCSLYSTRFLIFLKDLDSFFIYCIYIPIYMLHNVCELVKLDCSDRNRDGSPLIVLYICVFLWYL